MVEVKDDPVQKKKRVGYWKGKKFSEEHRRKMRISRAWQVGEHTSRYIDGKSNTAESMTKYRKRWQLKNPGHHRMLKRAHLCASCNSKKGTKIMTFMVEEKLCPKKT